MTTPTVSTLISRKNNPIVSYTFDAMGESVGSVLIVPAMGVPQWYYATFAKWLTEQHYTVTTFDYSGVGESLKVTGKPINQIDVNLFDWANDISLMVDTSIKQRPNQPLTLIGHSLGGQLLGLLPNVNQIHQIITVGTGNGYWLDGPPSLRNRVWFLWFFMVPIATRLKGYFPGQRFNMVGDLPKGVIQQWKRWCMNKNYVVGTEGADVRERYSQVTTPITSIACSDDEFMQFRNIDSLHSMYTNAPLNRIRLAPQDLSVTRIGHFGFFRSSFKDNLWHTHFLPSLAHKPLPH